MRPLINISPLKKQAIVGTFWTVGSFGFGHILRFVSNLILTRLLFPELFGMMALVNVFIIGLALFSDIGIGPSIIRHEKGDEPNFLNTAWTIQVLRGFVIWGGTLVIAYPISLVYNYPEMLWLIPIVGLTSVISGFASTSLITLNRSMDLKQLALFELVCQVVSLLLTIVWAWLTPSIWALVGSTIVSSVIRTLGSFLLKPQTQNRFAWDKDAIKEIIHFGKWIFLSSSLTFLSMQIDRLILGRAFSIELFGVFTIAYALSDIPRQVIGVVGDKILFPAASRLAHLPRPEFRKRLLRNRKWLLAIMAIGIALLACFGDLLIRLLYDQRYAQAAWMFPLLTLGIWPTALGHTLDTSLFAIGKIQSLTVGHVMRIVFNGVGILFAYQHFGIPGAVIVISLSNLPFYAAVLWGAHKEGLTDFRQDLLATMFFLGIIGLLLTIRGIFGFDLPIAGLWQEI